MFGKIVQGHVLDANVKEVEKALKAYDSKLYVKWNPKKNKGQGTWEIRREPEKKRLVRICEGFVELKYVENNMAHHVLDACPLDYRVLKQIKEMDVWAQSYYGKNFGKDFESEESDYRETEQARIREDMLYNLRQHRKEWKDFQEYVLSGGNPAHILSGRWG